MMHRGLSLIATAGALLLGGESAAQTRLLAGVVKDSVGMPIEAASVVAGQDGARTDADGMFVLPLPKADSVTVAIRRLGFEPVVFSLSVEEAAGNTIEIVMNRVAHQLDEVRVQAMEARAMTALRNFDERRKLGLGKFITRDEIDRRHASRLSQLMSQQPGVVVYPTVLGETVVKFAMYQHRTCAPQMFIDGQYAPGIDINTVHPMDIEGVEIYGSLSTVPSEFVRDGGNRFCGSIAIWTRRPVIEQSKEKKPKP